MKKNIFLLLAITLLTFACKDDKGTGNACDNSLRPIVMVHGFLASGDTYELQFQRFESNGYCSNNLYVLNWNSLAFGEDATGVLDELIDKVIAETGADQVDLMGHSAGSSTAYSYLSTADRANKVAHYVHIGGNPEASPAGAMDEVPTLNIWSEEDLVVTGGNIPGATNFKNEGKDHYEVATSVESFEQMYTFFNDGKTPTTLTITPENDILVSGTVLTFGENMPIVSANVNVYEVSPETGMRTGPAAATLFSNSEGNYGPAVLNSGVHYEFEVIPNDGTRTVHYYREPFVRSHQLVVLRTLPSGGLGNVLLGGLPVDDNQTVLAFYSGSKGIINGRDILTVGENTLSTAEFAAAENATIAMFYYDGNNNQTTDLTNIGGAWDLVPTFLEAVDMFIPTEESNSVELNLNGNKIVVPNLKSGVDGVIVAQFY
ncbi:MAG: hypothetical protein ACI94Y_003859 [Maribacter sp.]|jgi:hypothetical protein